MLATLKIFSFAMVLFTIALGTASAQVQINNIGAGLSYWNRMYSGIDERGFLINYPGEGGFGAGALMPTLSAEINLIESLALDGRIGLWSSSFTGEGVSEDGANIVEEMDQRLIPVALGLIYTFRHIVPDRFNAFVGAGLNRYFIQNTMERNVADAVGSISPQIFTGNNFGAYAKAGFEYMLWPQLGVVLEGRYHTGSYNHIYFFEPEASPVYTKVALQGPEVGLSIRYMFFPMFGEGYSVFDPMP